MSYESPIEMFYSDTIQNIANQIREETDDRIVCEVKMQCGVNIDKDELLKALKYDRGQYEKGYQDAMTDAREIAEWIEDSGNIACSHCHTIWLYRRTDFCPNCGAKMRKEADNETDN